MDVFSSRISNILVEGQPYGQIHTKAFERNPQGRILINDLGLPVTTRGQTVPMGSWNTKNKTAEELVKLLQLQRPLF